MTRSPAWFAGVFALAAGACVTPAHASDATTDVDVSRVTLKLPGTGWTVSDKLPYGVVVDSSGLTVDGERRLVVAGPQGSRAEIVMLVSATRGHGGVTLHAECDPQDDGYIHKFNRGQSNYIPLQCLRVFGPGALPTDRETLGEDLGGAMASQRVSGPAEGYLVLLTVSNENGAVVKIHALLGADFAGLAGGRAATRLPEGLPEPVAAWADTLAENALGTLSSLFARLVVPPVVFSPPPASGRVATKD